MTNPIRKWDTGGMRDTDEGKLDYEGFLSPVVLKRFAQYMHPHRKMADGSIRDSDNWQKGFGTFGEHAVTCMKSLTRHFMHVWCIHRCDEECANDDLEEALCGVMFNAMAWLHRLLKSKQDFNKEEYLKDLKAPGNKVGELENNAENTM